MRTLFVGDLHLSADRPDITAAFSHFLATLPSDTQALYILGDLFEVWVGDDLAEPFALALAQQLRDIAGKIPVYYVHGNRDFMLGRRFAKQSGMQLLPEVSVTQLYGHKLVILHGDSLCTLDKAYQRFRRFRSIALFRWIYSLLPKRKRQAIASGLRAKSKQGNQYKTREIMDVESSAVLALMQQKHADIMIHGHTHRPAIHQLGDQLQRMVVGDWYTQGSVLTLTPQGAELSNLPLE
ncbi:UDP-2,3-diacylglucosamine hydrolase [Shewanella sp. NFH-SH190041]|uniref:UDP-2,3-diacylglucosamine diphosphatase n=1 Tax=Shewanella sp. NFH-SH190041 TaxID=2950245 RepID=UPI0021C3CBC7|nr:UDP-2,3-diacylglucosamine diphosphatase [Shewanella sp. NFH-SH190041]BDM65054.1 UDP-2,3-diacylglucosamine hydrolase [Shewanella sp. NFH-SH190041]